MEPEQAAVETLIPNGIENFVPSCLVCKHPVPKKRATSRSKDTCSAECNKILRKYRQHVLRSSKCPTCYHPSTPQERMEFIQWRRWRGDLREKRGRPPVRKEELLRLALQEAIGLLKQETDPNRLWAEPIERFEKLVDTNGVEQSKLAQIGRAHV